MKSKFPLGPKNQSNIPYFYKSHHHFKFLTSQTDLLIFSSKLVLFHNHPCHCHHFLLITQIKVMMSSWMLSSSFILYIESVTKNVFLPSMHLSDSPFPFYSYTWSSFLHLELDVASCLIFLLQMTPPCSPGSPGHLANSCRLSFLKCCS